MDINKNLIFILLCNDGVYEVCFSRIAIDFFMIIIFCVEKINKKSIF